MLLKKIFYTIAIISAIRIGNFIPISGINQAYLYDSLKGSSILSLLNTFSQGKQFILGIFSVMTIIRVVANSWIKIPLKFFSSKMEVQKTTTITLIRMEMVSHANGIQRFIEKLAPWVKIESQIIRTLFKPKDA